MANEVRSISFPFRSGPSSFPAMETDVAGSVFNSIKSLLLTSKNERVMRTDFGSNAHELVFDNLTPILKARIATDVKRTVDENEPRVVVLAVDASENPQNPRAIIVDVLYRLGGQTIDQQVPI